MTRLSLSDMVQVQQAQLDHAQQQLNQLAAMMAQALQALTERRTASETVTIKRMGTGDHATTTEVQAVTQDGEDLAATYERARLVYEQACARFPLPSGATHPAPLGAVSQTREEAKT